MERRDKEEKVMCGWQREESRKSVYDEIYAVLYLPWQEGDIRQLTAVETRQGGLVM